MPKIFFTNIIFGFAAQSVSMLTSFLSILIFPKLLDVQSFSYWQLFIFYSSYTGFVHLGINDGIYLLYGGKNRQKIDLAPIKSQFKAAAGYHILVATLFVTVIEFCVNDHNRRYVLFSVAFFAVVNNVGALLGYFYQSVNQTRLYSIGILIAKLFFVLSALICCLLGVNNYQVFVALYCATQLLAFVFYVHSGKDIFASCNLHALECLKVCKQSIYVGLNLMLANIAGMLTIGFGRMLVDYEWGVVEFGKLSLGLAAVNFTLQFISQISMVLFPMLRRVKNEALTSFYVFISRFTFLSFSLSYLVSYPAYVILLKWLPDYSTAFAILFALMPIAVFDGHSNLCSTTLIKVMRRERALLFVNLFGFLISLFIVTITVYWSHNIYYVAYALVVSVILRSLVADFYVRHALNVRSCSIQVISCILAAGYVTVFAVSISVWSWIIIGFFYAALVIYYLPSLRLQLHDLRTSVK